MADWYDTKTPEHLKEAFAGGSEAGRRYLYFARQGDVEGYPGVAARFRAVAEGREGVWVGAFRCPGRGRRCSHRRGGGCHAGQPCVRFRR